MENHSITILLVEDDAGDTELLRESFRRSTAAHNQLLVASTGADALALLNGSAGNDRSSIGLVLLDLTLPDTSGHELLTQIRAIPECRHIPVVVLTGSTNDDDMRRSYASGANAYLIKPVDMGRFIRMVNLLDEFWVKLVSVPGELRATNGSEPR